MCIRDSSWLWRTVAATRWSSMWFPVVASRSTDCCGYCCGCTQICFVTACLCVFWLPVSVVAVSVLRVRWLTLTIAASSGGCLRIVPIWRRCSLHTFSTRSCVCRAWCGDKTGALLCPVVRAGRSCHGSSIRWDDCWCFGGLTRGDNRLDRGIAWKRTRRVEVVGARWHRVCLLYTSRCV